MRTTIGFSGLPPFAADMVKEKWVLNDCDFVFLNQEDLPSRPCDALVCFAEEEINTADFSRLRFIQLLKSGSDYLDYAKCKAANVTVANHGDANAQAVAEQALLFMLLLLRRYHEQREALLSGDWRKGVPVRGLQELKNKKVGILGIGAIGQKTAAFATAFGAQVSYCDKISRDLPYPSVSFETLLQESDILAIQVPLTPETRHLLNTKTIGMMKKGALLLNLARGGIVEEEALLTALKSGHLGGAALDVFDQEPPDPTKFADIPNLVVTPHRAGSSRENWASRMDFALENIKKWRACEEVSCRIL